MRRTFFSSLFGIGATCACLLAALPHRASGAVQLHTGPGDEFPVAGSVAAGETLAVVGEEGAWCKVAAPAAAPAWIYGEFVRGSVVSVPLAAVRSGPGIEHPVLTKLRLGEPVKVLQAEGTWARIEMPARCELWIRRAFLSKNRVVEASAPVPPPGGQTPQKKPESLPSSPPPPARAPAPPASLPQGASVELTGVVERIAFAWRSPARYHLMSDDGRRPRAVLAFLAGSEADLARAEGKRVSVAGRQSSIDGVRYPLVRVVRISEPGAER